MSSILKKSRFICHHWDRPRQTFLIISKVISNFSLTPGMHALSSETHSTPYPSHSEQMFTSLHFRGLFGNIFHDVTYYQLGELYHQLAESSVNKGVYFPIENQGCELLNLTSLTARKPWMPSLLLTWSLSTWSAICLMFAQHLVSKELSEKVGKKINISAHLDSLSPFSAIHTVLGRDTSDPCVVRTLRRHSVWLSEQSMAFN